MDVHEKFHEVASVRTDESFLYLSVDGQSYRVAWSHCANSLVEASPMERVLIQVSPAGYGLHWPLIDEDLAIEPLLRQAELLTGENNAELVTASS